jgi:tRNA A-37 threonylcarbamoyl transferase component Bud32
MLAGYRVEEIIGIGGMGIVYRAEQVALRRRVALKVLTPQLSRDASYRERFRREGAHAAALHHPNVVPVFDSGELDGILYLAMMLVEGTSLADVLADGPIPLAEAVRILRPIAAALDAAHGVGIVHRDVKPQNVLLDRSGTPLLADFGVAKASASATNLTATRDFVGSINYSAPEQIRGDGVTAAADVYGLSAVLFACLDGSPPFQRDSDAAVLHAQLNDPPPKLKADLARGSELDAILQRGLAKAPEERPASAGGLIDDASALLVPGESVGSGGPLMAIHPPVVSPQSRSAPPATALDGAAATLPVGPPPAPAGVTHADRRRPSTAKAEQSKLRPNRARGRWAVAAVAAVFLGTAAIVASRHHDSRPPTKRVAKDRNADTAPAPISLVISSPANETTTPSTTITVRGTVTPASATVEVQGGAAENTGGAFSRTVSLASGTNTVKVLATAAGRKSADASVTVLARPLAPRAEVTPAATPHAPTLETQQPPDGSYTILVPAGWQYFAESSPEGTTTDLWQGPSSSEKLQVVTNDCGSCAEADGAPSARPLALPPGTTSSFEINSLATGFEARVAGNPNPDNGVIVVTRDGSAAAGYAQVDLWLPASLHDMASQILDSFSMLKATTE